MKYNIFVIYLYLIIIFLRLFDWRPDKIIGERGKHENVVIVKNLFEKETFDNDISLLLEYQNDLREECSKCGVVKKVIVYDVSLIIFYLKQYRFLIKF